MRKLGTVLLMSTVAGAFLALAACGTPPRNDDAVSYFGSTTVRVDVDRARSTDANFRASR